MSLCDRCIEHGCAYGAAPWGKPVTGCGHFRSALTPALLREVAQWVSQYAESCRQPGRIQVDFSAADAQALLRRMADDLEDADAHQDV